MNVPCRGILYWAVRKCLQRKWRHFEARTREIRQNQKTFLFDLIKRNKNTAFGTDHGFSKIRTFDDYRKSVPLCEYEVFRPYIEKMKSGEKNQLLPPDENVRMFSLTSGTTRDPKYIPLTDRFIAQYIYSWRIWLGSTLQDHPRAFDGQIFGIASNHREKILPDGTACGAISGMTTSQQSFLTRALYAIPGCVAEISDSEVKRQVLMRLALAADVSLICTPNPSRVLNLIRAVEEDPVRFIRDIRDGGIGADARGVEKHVPQLAPLLAPDPARAAFLDKLAHKYSGLYPKDYWPNLAVVGNWKGGTLKHYLKQYPKYFGDIPVRDIGLIASEGRMSIPIRDEGSGGILDLGSNFYEFVPVDDDYRQIGDPRYPWELELGRRYEIVLTTLSGLYRYRIHDVVEVEAFHGETPVIAFISKGSHFSSITGEKLTEHQVVSAVDEISSTLSIPAGTFSMIPKLENEVPYYVLYVERSFFTRQQIADEFAGLVDRALKETNCEYAEKRNSGRLGEIRVEILAAGTFDEYQRRVLSSRGGGRDEQYKHVSLVAQPQTAASLLECQFEKPN